MATKAIVSLPTKLVCYGEEKSDFHTRLLRTSLCLEESRAYWEHSRDDIP